MLVLAVLLLLSTLMSCNALPHSEPEGHLAHTVYFWLKADADPALPDAMVRYYQHEVVRAPGVVSVFAGVARPSDRDVVDDSFSVGTTVVFASSAAEVACQTEPIHDELKRRFLPSVDHVVVYDTLITSPH